MRVRSLKHACGLVFASWLLFCQVAGEGALPPAQGNASDVRTGAHRGAGAPGTPPPEATAGRATGVRRRVRYSFTLRNTTGTVLSPARFSACGPVKDTATQSCVDLKPSEGCSVVPDDLGNQVLHFSLPRLPPYATKVIAVEAEVLLRGTPAPVVLSDRGAFLEAEELLPSTHPEIVALARKLRGPEDAATVKRIFSWIVENLEYSGHIANERGALYALEHRKGDCTEFADLLVTLCRANGIPARCIAGYVCSKDTVLEPSDYHNWAEVYLGGAWRIVDPQKRAFMDRERDYVAFRIIRRPAKDPAVGSYRFRAETKGLSVKMDRKE